MPLSMLDAAELIARPSFLGRVQANMVSRASNIIRYEGDTDPPPNHAERAAFADAVLRAPGVWVTNFGWIVATWETTGDGGAGDAIEDDGALNYVVDQAWNIFSEPTP